MGPLNEHSLLDCLGSLLERFIVCGLDSFIHKVLLCGEKTCDDILNKFLMTHPPPLSLIGQQTPSVVPLLKFH